MFGGHCAAGLYTFNFNLLVIVVEDLERFRKQQPLNASSYERSDVPTKRAFRST